jgi:hypothetical protein
MTVARILLDVIRHPGLNLIGRWNWKAAMCSAASRGLVFCLVNLPSGPAAGIRALVTEFVLRGATAGFYGAVTQSLSGAQPAWTGTVCAVVLLPLVAHSAEFLAHSAAGTTRLGASIAASVTFTVLTTLFNTFAMRRGVLTVGPDSGSFIDDLRALPRVMAAFLAVVPRALRRATGSGAA